jgi:hypothetical protein
MQRGEKIKSTSLVLFICLLVSISDAQQIIKNSDTPINKNAGRTVFLEELFRIEDDGETSIFRVPKHLATLGDGSLLFLDFPSLYKFSKDGQFVFKILKQGNGPRECRYPNNFIIQGNRIRVTSSAPSKVLDYDLGGQYIQETKEETLSGLYYIKNINGEIYGIREEIRYSSDKFKEGIVESPFRLYKISNDFKTWTKVYDFPIRHYIKNRSWPRLDMFDAVSYKDFLFVVNSAEYRIVKFDLKKSEIERIFHRKYIRQKIRQHEESDEDYGIKQFSMPRFDYYFDIFGIHIIKDSLWVITSTRSEDNTRWLVDLFDMEGKYTDSFHLQFPKKNMKHELGWALFSDDGHIYIPEQSHETGYISIGKYRLKD